MSANVTDPDETPIYVLRFRHLDEAGRPEIDIRTVRIGAASENAAITCLRKDVAAAGVPGLRIDRVQRDGGPADETPKRGGKHWLLLGFMAVIALSRFLGGS